MHFPEPNTNFPESCINYFKQNFFRGKKQRLREIPGFLNGIFSPEKDIFLHTEYFFKTINL